MTRPSLKTNATGSSSSAKTAHPQSTSGFSANGQATRRRKTGHLKQVPQTRALREEIRRQSIDLTTQLDKSEPLAKGQMESLARQILTGLNLPEGHVGWTMVVLASAFWQDQVAAVAPERRLLLLPHCLKHAEGCPADYDQFGLDCKKCGACSIADFRQLAEEMGYKVLVAEGSPIVMKIIASGYVDAIVGVACLNVLEKAIDKILLAGIPCMAVPLLSSDCRNTSVDEDWVEEMIRIHRKNPQVHTRTYLHLIRGGNSMFDAAELQRLAPRRRGKILSDQNTDKGPPLDPVSATESIAYEFLARGGKHSRPFITLAAYDALTGAHGTSADGAEHLRSLPDAIRRTALSIEAFHKASLIHDDIEDDDEFRYGDPSLHRQYGMPIAINVGDFLIGFGYRLVSCEAESLGQEVVVDILDRLADAHTRLSEGQGAELLWRDLHQKTLSPLDALKIYALKTAPAFEVALYAGLRLADCAKKYLGPVKQLAKNLGIAFQILNDLKDWEGDSDNKLSSGGDVLQRRPTLLLALAADFLSKEDCAKLEKLVSRDANDDTRIQTIRQLYEKADVFQKAHNLVDKYQERAETVVDEVDHDELRRLLYYLVDTVLDRPAVEIPLMVSPSLPTESSVVTS